MNEPGLPQPADPTKWTFFDIPREIRDSMYAEALGGHTLEIVVSSTYLQAYMAMGGSIDSPKSVLSLTTLCSSGVVPRTWAWKRNQGLIKTHFPVLKSMLITVKATSELKREVPFSWKTRLDTFLDDFGPAGLVTKEAALVETVKYFCVPLGCIKQRDGSMVTVGLDLLWEELKRRKEQKERYGAENTERELFWDLDAETTRKIVDPRIAVDMFGMDSRNGTMERLL
ncbi:uncharacterized protein BDZ99DRAFT_555353 [Mytilinidion resinicola]|uniref:Uncharacterized protein n=1 Tax=Mytilinidion resinicola TaxID=574789 RepID=A0A6A6Y0I1_9PEZI|nr:uncharacterized protein BDZ99DRAFT_555353 [Mytilinidion resinicola]KAF2801317.1 hypothetical protein BDZ99DRAFT_555353 [Mytilinidion resinicola]